MNNKLLADLSNAILSVKDLKGNNINYNEIKIESYIDEKSPYKNDYNVGCFVDGKKLSVRDKKVTYLCSCGCINTIYLKKYIIKTRLVCQHCREDEEKRYNHSLFFKTGVQKSVIGRKTKQIYDFDNERQDFKDHYYKTHLTKEEFQKIVEDIVSIGDIDIIGKEIEYLEHENVRNRSKYAPYVLIDGKRYKFENVKVRCPQCGQVYKISDSRSKKVKFNTGLSCKECVLANKRYPIMFYNTKFGDYIKYQGNTELTFIKECERNNVRVINGPVVPYAFQNKNHNYHIDFELPDLNILIEIKGNHIWHKQNIASGKWPAKEESARKFASERGKQYYLLFNKDIDSFINKHI